MNTQHRHKYPRTFHVPWSRSKTDDDKTLSGMDHFVGRRVVVTSKLDGENTTLGRDYVHARSVDSRHHPSRDWVKQLHGRIAHEIPEGWRICGENMYAQHSIAYNDLPTYFFVFSIWDENNTALSWDDTVMYCELLGLEHVPVLYDGLYDEASIRALWPGKPLYGERESEGYVIRSADPIPYDDFKHHVAKFVRKGHVQTDTHWMHAEVKPNGLAE